MTEKLLRGKVSTQKTETTLLMWEPYYSKRKCLSNETNAISDFLGQSDHGLFDRLIFIIIDGSLLKIKRLKRKK